MTDKQCRDKAAHAIRDAIKQNKSSPQNICFSSGFGGMFNPVSDIHNDEENQLAVRIFGTYDNNVDADALLTWEEDSSSVTVVNTKPNKLFKKINSNESQPALKPHMSIYEHAMADCHHELSTAPENDWFLKVIEWTLGSNGAYDFKDKGYG